MSAFSKFLLFLIVLACIATIVLGLMLEKKKQAYRAQLAAIDMVFAKDGPMAKFREGAADTPAAVTQIAEQLNRAWQDRTALQEKASFLENDLRDLKSSQERMVIELSEASKQVVAINAQLSEAKAEVEPLQTRLQALEGSLKGRTPESLYEEIETLQKKIASPAALPSSSSSKPSASSASSATPAVNSSANISAPASSPSASSASTSASKPQDALASSSSGQKAKILAVNKQWNFVVLNVGKESKLPQGVDLTVYHDQKAIGKVRTVSVETRTSVADILPEFVGAGIAVGDYVVFEPAR